MITFLLASLASFSQVLKIPSGNLTITGSSYFEIRGSFEGTTGSQTINDGSTFTLTGDFTVDAASTYTSTGTDEFVGALQTVSGIYNTSYFNLFKRNQAVAGSEIVLATNTDCNTLDLGGAVLGTINVDQFSATLYVQNTSHAAITNYSNNAYVDVGDNSGYLKRTVDDITVGNWYEWPIGNSIAGYRQFDMNFQSLGATGASTVILTIVNGPTVQPINFSKRYTTGFSNTYPGPCTPGTNPQWVDFTCLTDNRWLTYGPSDYVFVVSGTGTVCDPGGLGIKKVLWARQNIQDYQAQVETSIQGSVTTSHCVDASWSLSAAYLGGPYKGATAEMTIAGGAHNTPLPVGLVYLQAVPINNDYIEVSWRTASELNNAYFYLMRSVDGIDFDSIGWFRGYGTTDYPHNYRFNDSGAIPGVLYYYKLRQVDFDGSEHFSPMVDAFLIKDPTRLVLMPNPTTGMVHVSIPVATIIVYDVLGNHMRTFTDTSDFDISDLASGTYVCIVFTKNGNRNTFKMVKK